MIEIKNNYEHIANPSVFVMFNKRYEVVWCYSGNELARIYRDNPEEFISGPLELPITPELDQELTRMMDNY